MMKSPMLDTMRQATRAMRDGDTASATQLIQQALSGTAPSGEPFDGVTIEGTVARDAERHHAEGSAAPGGETLPMLSRTHGGTAGARDYKLFLPPRAAAEGVRGLVVMLHGCTQNADDFARGTAMNAIAAREGLIVAYPNQTTGSNPNGCWNWFEPLNQRRGAGEPAILAGLAQEVARAHGVPEGAVFAAGLSAGGAMAAILGEAYPDVFSAVGVHSGLAAGSAQDVPSAFAAMNGTGAADGFPVTPDAKRARVMVVHGTRDRTVVAANGARVFERMQRAFPAARMRRDPAGEGGMTRLRLVQPDGTVVAEYWEIDGLAHAWSGGDGAGSFTAPRAPGASEGFVRFFLDGTA